jgi:tRNA (guanine9-N1)-methyltransferase
MNNAAYKRWTGTEWWQEGYERLWSGLEMEPTDDEGNIGPGVTQESVIYLTADSDVELLELIEGETYIIGGICDHNRYKVSYMAPRMCSLWRMGAHLNSLQNLCLNKAIKSNIRTARLPIGRFLASLTTRKVLTVNQVFEILVKWVETRNWEEALYSVIPKRKFVADGNRKQDDDDEVARDDEEADDDDDTAKIKES